MTKVQSITLISVLLSIPVAYMMLNKPASEKVIIIPQLNIESKKPIKTIEEVDQTIESEEPSTILSRLQNAVASSQEKVTLSKEEEAKEILKTLKKSTYIIKPKKPKVSYSKKSTIAPLKPKKIVKKEKKSIPVSLQPKIKIVKSVKKELPTTSKTKVIPNQKKIVHIKKGQAPKKISKLSRKEEVEQYKKKHQNELEVIGVSQLFEINEQQERLPDSHYFEPIVQTKKEHSNQPLEEVKTLGVVEISSNYEVANVEIPEKIELAKEALVDISSASVETKELKELKFVDTLEVLEVSPTFETIEAEKYIK